MTPLLRTDTLLPYPKAASLVVSHVIGRYSVVSHPELLRSLQVTLLAVRHPLSHLQL